MQHNDSDRTKRRKIVSIVKSTVENISSNSSSVTINSVVNASSVVEVNETNEIVNDNLVYSFTLSNEHALNEVGNFEIENLKCPDSSDDENDSDHPHYIVIHLIIFKRNVSYYLLMIICIFVYL